jgi:DNA-binding beta-propeller fold protein YncE
MRMARNNAIRRSLGVALVAAALFSSSLHASAASTEQTDTMDYRAVRAVPLGGSVEWDNVYFEPVSHRVFVAHGDEVTVVDGLNGELVGRVQGLDGVHGVAAISELGKGYAVSRGRRVATSFSLKSLLRGKSVPIGRAGDFLVYDPRNRRIFVMDQEAPIATVIDAANDLFVATVHLGGIAEQAVADGSGHILINLADNREIIRVDTQALKVEFHWPVPNCESPHGSAVDNASQRLFVSCLNEKLVVLDTVNGRTIAILPIGKGTDGAAYDGKRKRVFSSNGGDGTLSVIAQLGSDQYALIRNVPTARFGRTMALDPDTGRIYIPVADLERIDPHPATKWGAYVFKPGSLRLMIFDPQP